MTLQIVKVATTMIKIIGPDRTVQPTPVQGPWMVEGRRGFPYSFPRTEIYNVTSPAQLPLVSGFETVVTQVTLEGGWGGQEGQ